MSSSDSEARHYAPASADDREYGEESAGLVRRSAFRALVQDFGPLWFTWCMNAGIIGILLHELPYQFHGLPVLSTIAFMFDLVLFIVASVLMIIRLVWFGKEALIEIIDNVETLALLAAWPISWLTLVSFVSLTVSEAYWGGYPWTVVAYVMWWIGAAWMVTTFFVVVSIIITRHNEFPDGRLTPFMFVPVVGVATLATIGGLLASHSEGISSSLAIPVIICSFFALGSGVFVGLFLYTVLFHELLVKGWPEKSHSPTMFLFIGPTGQYAAALQTLGDAANTYGRFAGANEGTFLTKMAAAPLDVACVLIGLLFSGLGVSWVIFAFILFIYRACRKELFWTPMWNAIIFPTGTFTTSMLMLSIELESTFFRVITAILVVFMVVIFFVNLLFTIWEVLHGRLLVVKDDPRAKKKV